MADHETPSILEQIAAMDSSRKLMALVVVAVAATAIWYVAGWANRPNYITLYRDLELGEAADISAILDAAAIPNDLGNGTEVRVPARRSVEAQVALAAEGHSVTGRPGLELFDRTTWGMTDFTQRITQQRALEGELSRTIGRIRGVGRAEVHLTLSETGPLRNLLRSAKAAVVLTARHGGTIPASSVEGIAQLVSSAVPDLSVEDVVVVDNGGVRLSGNVGSDEEAAALARQMERQRTVESEQAGKVLALLAPILGPGQASVQVSAEMNFEQIDRTVETFDPEGQVILSEQRTDNQPGTGAAAQGQSTVISNQFQNSRSVERVLDQGGDVMRITVAIALNESAVEGQVGNDPQAVARFTRNVQEMASNAVGIDATRGDRLSVTTVPFGDPLMVAADAAPNQVEPAPTPLELAERFSRPVAGVLGVLLTFVLASRVLKPMMKPAPQRLAAAGTGGGGQMALPDSGNRLELPKPQASVGSQIKEQIFQETSDIGETGASVVRSWLGEQS